MANFTVRLVGGLGNQLHCYAFGKALAAHQNADVCFDCDSGFWADPYGRCYLLDQFTHIVIKKKPMPKNPVGRWLYRLLFKVGSMLSSKLPLVLRPLVMEPAPQRFREDILTTSYVFNPYFIGYWASYRYSQRIEQSLRTELQPPYPDHPDVLEWLKKVSDSQSCFIHYRSYREEKNGSRPSMADYYRKAVVSVADRIPGVKFFVFSDHYDSVRAELSAISLDLEFVQLEQSVGDVNSLNDFYLMYACDHAIIGDSTFSWWAAWLSDRDGKVVVVPEGLSPWGKDWVPQHWLGIHIKKETWNRKCQIK